MCLKWNLKQIVGIKNNSDIETWSIDRYYQMKIFMQRIRR